MKYLLILLSLFAIIACDISSIDYAIGDIEITGKTPVTIDAKPAMKLIIQNTSDTDKSDIVITVKAKKNQEDISIITIELSEIKANEQIERYAVFGNLVSHTDYDFVTYAVSETNH